MLKGLWKKFLASEYKLIICAVILVAVLVVVIVVSNNTGGVETSDNTDSLSELELKLEKIISAMEGCGKTTVSITYESSSETVYAYESETKATGNSTTTSEKIVLVNGEPLVLKQIPPNILGVVIVAEGGDNVVVCFKIKQVVSTLLDVDETKIQVFKAGN